MLIVYYKHASSSKSKPERQLSDSIYKAKYLMARFHKQLWPLASWLTKQKISVIEKEIEHVY